MPLASRPGLTSTSLVGLGLPGQKWYEEDAQARTLKPNLNPAFCGGVLGGWRPTTVTLDYFSTFSCQ